jgi:hypothetical protein
LFWVICNAHAGLFHADVSTLACGTYSVSISGNGQEFECTAYDVFVHQPLTVSSITPPCASIAGGTVVSVDLGLTLHVPVCQPLIMLSSCDAAIPAVFSSDGRHVTFNMPVVQRTAASNTLKFSANGGSNWTTVKEFPLFGE